MSDTELEEPGTLPGEWPKDDRSIHERMVAILTALPAIGKEQRNEQQNFMYRGHDDVLNALNPLLAEHGVFVVPEVVERVTAERTTSSNKTMYEVNLHVRYRFYGANGDYISASAWGEGTDLGDKATSKAMTMAFKSVLAQALAISTSELSDADAGSPEPTTRGPGAAQPAPRASRPPKAQPEPESPDFDPGKHTAPGAIKGEGFLEQLGAAFKAIDPSVDWKQMLNEIAGDAPKDETFWRRVSNAVWKLGDLTAFPPPDDDAVIAAFAWAFEGTVVELNRPIEAELDEEGLAAAEREDEPAPLTGDEVEAALAADDDIPFGPEEEADAT